MKNISRIMTCLVALLVMWGCKEDTTPRLDKDPATLAATFTINTPPMANQYFYLSDGNEATFDLSCSQPDYGFSVVANYAVMVSLSDKFEHNAKFAHEGETDYFPKAGDYVELRDPGTVANMQVKQLYLTRAINKLLTFENADGVESQITSAAELEEAMQQHYPDGYLPVYIKIRCYVPQAEDASSVVTSNYVVLSKVIPSFSLEQPSKIYLDGGFCGWFAPDASAIADNDDTQPEGKLWPLSELVTEIDSKIFRASFYLSDFSDTSFRFYMIPPANGWGATGSYGASMDDFTSDEIKLEDGSGEHSIVVGGQGNFVLTNADGSELQAGWYDFVVDLNTLVFSVSKVSTPTYPTNYTPAN